MRAKTFHVRLDDYETAVRRIGGEINDWIIENDYEHIDMCVELSIAGDDEEKSITVSIMRSA